MKPLSKQSGNYKLQTKFHMYVLYTDPQTQVKGFIDDFTEFMVDAIAEYSNLIVDGDFNMHISKEENPNASILWTLW